MVFLGRGEVGGGGRGETLSVMASGMNDSAVDDVEQGERATNTYLKLNQELLIYSTEDIGAFCNIQNIKLFRILAK